jgi:glycopeptide antibiotics resistance protein
MNEQPAVSPDGRARRWLIASLVVYLGLLTWLVLWKLGMPYVGEGAFIPRPFKWIPFISTAEAGASPPLELLGNLLLFVPLGLFVGSLRPAWMWWQALLAFAGVSALFELAQHYLSIGSFDSTDVLVNTLGGMAGLGLATLARRRWRDRTTAVMAKVMTVITAVALVASVAFAVSPMRYNPTEDVIVPGVGED